MLLKTVKGFLPRLFAYRHLAIIVIFKIISVSGISEIASNKATVQIDFAAHIAI